eukprot:GFUD01036067.1.p1 GENE.GFUD01036067.1~~GFUD01036067.1.p1  ORF type:complete len:444 (+),score=99.80 GFUD01036067.1:61-1392(+)
MENIEDMENKEEISETENVVEEAPGIVKEKKPSELISANVALVHLMKGNIGIGVLAMPSALVNAGLAVGTIGLAVVAVITVHCMHLLVNATHVLCERHNSVYLDYGEVVQLSLLPHSRRFSSIGLKTINVFICITQLGGNSVYVLFIVTSLQQLCENLIGLDWSIYYYVLLLWLPIVLLCLLRNLRLLAPVTVVATVCELYALATVFYYIFRDPLPAISSVPASVSISKLPLFFGTAIFTFEGIGIVLPLENRMKNPANLRGLNGVLNTGMVIVACLYIATGFYGYLKYGEAASIGAVTLNLPTDELLANSARVAITAAIFLTYPLQFYVLISIIVPNLVVPNVVPEKVVLYEYLLRVGIVTISFLLASLVPYLDLFISLAGALCMSSLSLIAPAIVDTATHWEQIGRWRLAKNIFIFVFGLVGTITGTILSVLAIVNKVTHP